MLIKDASDCIDFFMLFLLLYNLLWNIQYRLLMFGEASCAG